MRRSRQQLGALFPCPFTLASIGSKYLKRTLILLLGVRRAHASSRLQVSVGSMLPYCRIPGCVFHILRVPLIPGNGVSHGTYVSLTGTTFSITRHSRRRVSSL